MGKHFLAASFHHHEDLSFDEAQVCGALRGRFPDVTIEPGDKLSERRERGEDAFSSDTPGVAQMFNQMREDVRDQGPARAFEFTVDDVAFKGVFRRRSIQLLHDDDIDSSVVESVRKFVRDLLPRKPGVEIEISDA